jgi:hypothetical protein
MNHPLSCAFQDAMTPRQTHWTIGLGFTTQDWQQASSDGGQSGDSARTTATTPPNGTASSSTHSEAGRFKHLARGGRWRPKVLVAKGNFQVVPDAVHCRLLRLCRCVSYCELIHSIDAYWFRERWLIGDCGGATGIRPVCGHRGMPSPWWFAPASRLCWASGPATGLGGRPDQLARGSGLACLRPTESASHPRQSSPPSKCRSGD